MKCIYPQERSYRDLYGVKRFFTCPCGKCVACLHNKQDSWVIRALEQTKATPMFVYDTLTFRQKDLPLVEVSDILDSLPVELSEQSRYMLRFYSPDCSKIPYVDRKLVSDWIKRGRELYFKTYGKRPSWKYLIFMEYGPRTSRPHFHLLWWNISKSDYIRFLGLPWRVRFGKTKPSYFNGNSSEKDRNCIVRYISKYCSKGVFESPWVKDNLLPKPFKMTSQGVGLSYIFGDKFSFFYRPLSEVFKGMSIDERFKTSCLERTLLFRSLIDLDITEGWSIPKQALDSLSVYFDSSGHPHCLPRYYKQKLLNLLHPNVFSFKVQTALLARAELQYYSCLQRFALSMGYAVGGLKSSTLGLGKKLFDILCRRFALAERLSAFTCAERCKTRLINHYLRPLRGVLKSPGLTYGVTSQFLALVC